MSDLSDEVTVLERIAVAIERLASVHERDEVRRAVRGLVKIQAEHPEEPVRRPLRVVR